MKSIAPTLKNLWSSVETAKAVGKEIVVRKIMILVVVVTVLAGFALGLGWAWSTSELGKIIPYSPVNGTPSSFTVAVTLPILVFPYGVTVGVMVADYCVSHFQK